MEYTNFKHIESEKDLGDYEKYLNKSCVTCKEISLSAPQKAPLQKTLPSPAFFEGYLKNHKGKLIKVESVTENGLECRIGILLEVGNDFLVIKLQKGCMSMMIPSRFIKYITIIHDNDMKKLGTKIR